MIGKRDTFRGGFEKQWGLLFFLIFEELQRWLDVLVFAIVI